MNDREPWANLNLLRESLNLSFLSLPQILRRSPNVEINMERDWEQVGLEMEEDRKYEHGHRRE